MPTDSSYQSQGSSARLSLVLHDAITRRLAGENLSDDQLIDANRDLMPDLANKLRELRMVEAARSLAENSSNPHHLSTLELPFSQRIKAEPIRPDALPGYQIIREIHRGGQGVVYLATQQSTRREVAVKVLREGPFAGPHDRMRFEREVHLLARLRHPNIVAIHDSGVAADHYFFVMDYVAGAPLDRWAESARNSKATTHDMLRLFRKICDAVNAAHLHGVIHRDLKPANVLVDEQGEPRILDFGLAKISTDGASSDESPQAMTREGLFLGSLPWSSPEQARGDNESVDIRSDVYSLGVMLYQMVTGRFPHDVAGPITETVNHILHDSPVRPSSIGMQIDDDAETIILKCLAKEPDRRYQSAGELSRELSRYLDGDPIEAKRDSGSYILKKWLSRHRLAAAVATSFIVLLSATAIALGIMYREQNRLRVSAEGEAKKAARTTAFLQDMLASVDPNQARGKQVAVRDVLDAASRTLDKELASEPQVAAAIHRTIGKTYETLGDSAMAETHHRAALEIGRRELGDEHPDTLAAMNGLATSLEALNRFDESETLFRQCLDVSRRVLGDDDHATLEVLHNLANLMQTRGRYDEAEALLNQALASSIAVLGPDHSETLVTRKVLADLWQDQGLYDKAEPAYREILAVQSRMIGDDSPLTMGTKQNLGMLLKAMGRLDEAEPLYREVIDTMKIVYEPDHPETLRTMNSYGRLLVAHGKPDEAEPVFRETLATQQRVLGEDRVDTLITTNNLALLLQDQGRLDDAEPLARKVLEVGRRALDEDHPDVLVWKNNLANLLSKKGKFSEAEPLYRETLEARRRVLTEDHPATITSLSNYAQVLLELKRPDEAEPLIRQAVEARRRILTEEHPDTLFSMGILGRVLLAQSRATEAESVLREALETAAQSLPPNHGYIPPLQIAYGKCLTVLQRFEEAEAMLLKSHDALKKFVAPSHPRFRDCVQAILELYEKWEKPEKAALYRATESAPAAP